MHGKRLYFSLPEELSQAIQDLSQQQSVTTFVTMLAALNVLFFRYTGQTDILIGVPASSRNHNLLKKLIGIFVNTLVLRSDLSGDPLFCNYYTRYTRLRRGRWRTRMCHLSRWWK